MLSNTRSKHHICVEVFYSDLLSQLMTCTSPSWWNHTHSHAHTCTYIYTHACVHTCTHTVHTLWLYHTVWVVPYARQVSEHLSRSIGLGRWGRSPYLWRANWVREKKSVNHTCTVNHSTPTLLLLAVTVPSVACTSACVWQVTTSYYYTHIQC